MDFHLNGRRHVLRGGQNEQRVHTVSEKEMTKLLHYCEGVQLCCIKVNDEGNSELLAVEGDNEMTTEIPQAIQQLLAD